MQLFCGVVSLRRVQLLMNIALSLLKTYNEIRFLRTFLSCPGLTLLLARQMFIPNLLAPWYNGRKWKHSTMRVTLSHTLQPRLRIRQKKPKRKQGHGLHWRLVERGKPALRSDHGNPQTGQNTNWPHRQTQFGKASMPLSMKLCVLCPIYVPGPKASSRAHNPRCKGDEK